MVCCGKSLLRESLLVVVWENLHCLVGCAVSSNGEKLQGLPGECAGHEGDDPEADARLRCEAFGEDDND